MENITIPKNCTECSYTTCCNNTYYGGTLCRYHKEINKNCLQRFWEQFKKDK